MSLAALHLAPALALLSGRAKWLLLTLAAGYLIGSFLTPMVAPALKYAQRITLRLGYKLDRPNRSVATRVYRGMVVVGLMVLPTTGIAAITASHAPALVVVLGIAWFGYCLQTLPSFTLWRRARNGQLPLELNAYLFADTYGVIRHLIRTRLDAFASGVVGASIWYLLAGFVGSAVYLTLGGLARCYQSPAFGWSVRCLFMVLDLVPQLVARLLLLVAGLLTTGARPFHALAARRWMVFIARLMDVSLGGASPLGDSDWVGDGTPKPDHRALRMLLTLTLAATILFLVVLGAPQLVALIAILR